MAFKWRSWTGVATVLFLVYGAANLLAAIVVPTTLITGGAGALGGGGVVFSGDADSYLVGNSLGGLRDSNPLLVSSMVGMCGQMIALGAVFLAVTWFAFRNGQRWALWTLLVGALIGWPHLIAIMAMYSPTGRSHRLWCFGTRPLPGRSNVGVCDRRRRPATSTAGLSSCSTSFLARPRRAL